MRGFTHALIGQVVTGIYYTSSETRMRVWRIDDPITWVQIADFALLGEDTYQGFGGDTDNYITVFDHARNDPDNQETVFLVAIRSGSAGGKIPFLFVVSTQFIGVIPYADFTGMSCAAALKELAVMTLSFVTVDVNRDGQFIGRAQGLLGPEREPIDLPAPFERIRSQIWEFYRTSVEVKGETPDGSSISAIAGDTGASARRETFTSKFITSEALAGGVAHQYLGYLQQLRYEEEGIWPEVQETVHALSRVTVEGLEYILTEVGRDVLRRENRLRMFSVEGRE